MNQVEETSFDASTCVIRVRGRNVKENKLVKVGGGLAGLARGCRARGGRAGARARACVCVCVCVYVCVWLCVWLWLWLWMWLCE